MKKLSIERIIPKTKIFEREFAIHIKRYEFAKDVLIARGIQGDILDIGCGVGYGSTYLADFLPGKVVGVDIDKDAILFAQNSYQNNDLKFQIMDGQALKFKRHSFKAVVSFETIEHIDHPEKLFSEIKRVLVTNGLLIISTPNKALTSGKSKKPKNPYHKREFTIDEFKQILNKYFQNVSLLGEYTDKSLDEKRRLYDMVNYLIDAEISTLRYLINFLIKSKNKIHHKAFKKIFANFRILQNEKNDIPTIDPIVYLKKLIKTFYISPAQSDIRIDRFHLETSEVLVAICR